MDRIRIEYLLGQFSKGRLTEEEKEELNSLLTHQQREEFEEQIAGMIASGNLHTETEDDALDDASFAKIMAADKPVKNITTGFFARNRIWIGAAAAFLVCALTGTFLFFRHQRRQNAPAPIARQLPEKQPGRNTAILTLADNSMVELGDGSDKIIGSQGRSQVVITGGRLAYLGQKTGASAVAYNRVTTPRGGEFALTLSDGTRIWLNAASALRFPASFTGPAREVELDGEAYFEVAADKEHPFEVTIRGKKVQVLGTQFNVMGYDDEAAIVTTLVDGSVQVASPGQPARTLVAGQHAVIDNQQSGIQVEQADVDEETAWKNGRTYFNGADIRQIMRQVSRWYNVDVQFLGEANKLKFTCTVARKDKLSKLLQLLELTGTVRFTMQGNTIIVHS
ncbi:MAG: FecR domain-containing protein [Bacteroidetes bacterium]|nr:FecR domain-containing protein [Bacteroidota bacterium]